MEWEDYFNKYKNMILSAAIIAFALIIANNVYKGQSREISQLKEQKENELKKNGILGNIGQSGERFNSYKKFLSKKDTSLVIDSISSIAKASNAKIVSVRPEQEQGFPLYIKYNLVFTVSLNDYLTLGKFISKLESSYDVYMVESVIVSPRSESSSEGGMTGLLVNLKISTYILKD